MKSTRINMRLAEYGVFYATRTLGILAVPVIFLPRKKLGQKSITGIFLPDQEGIIFCLDWLISAGPVEILMTAFHEARHAYQRNQVRLLRKAETKEPIEVVQRWETEFGAYHRASDSKTEDPQYLEQEIERDARDFAITLLQGFLPSRK